MGIISQWYRIAYPARCKICLELTPATTQLADDQFAAKVAECSRCAGTGRDAMPWTELFKREAFWYVR